MDEQEDSHETAEPTDINIPFSDTVVKQFEADFGARLLAKQPSGGWEIEHLMLRAGRAIHEIPLV